MTKNALDIANYDAEFNQLQDQLSNIRQEKFNGINLFSTGTSGPSGLSAYTTETGDGVINTTTQQVDTISVLSGDGTTANDEYAVTIDGTALGAAVAWAGTAADTATALATAINGTKTTNAGVLTAVANGSDVVVAAATAGEVFDLSITTVDNGAGAAGDVLPSVDSKTTTHVQTKSTSVLLTYFKLEQQVLA